MYILRYWYEHGGGCLWSGNEITKDKFGYKIDYNILPLSSQTKLDLNMLEKKYTTYLDWNNPADPSKWSDEEKVIFYKTANRVYQQIKNELGHDFLIINKLESSL